MVFVFDNVVINPWTMLYYRLFKCFVIYLFAIDVNFYICHIFVCLSLRSKCTVYCGIKHIVFFIRMSCRTNCIFCLLLIYNFLQVFRIILSRNYSQKKYTRKMFQFQIYLYIKSCWLYWYKHWNSLSCYQLVRFISWSNNAKNSVHNMPRWPSKFEKIHKDLEHF